MNASNFQHAAWALAFQIPLTVLTGNPWFGMVLGSAFFLGREVAQREYHLTQGGSVKGLKPWAGFDIANWGVDAKCDLLFPVAATTLFALALTIFFPYP